jgi:hypothetical protein
VTAAGLLAPLPGLLPTEAEQLGVRPAWRPACRVRRAGLRTADHHRRTGGPGAGKSGAAVLLILAALRYRDQASAGDKAKISVPVLFSAQDWNPSSELVADWLARKLGAA